MTGDPVRDAWEASGRPAAVPLPGAGQCARCGTPGPCARWQDVLSAGFGDWDRLPFRSSGVLCGACAWGFACKPLRTRPHLIGPGRCGPADAAALRAALSAAVPRSLLVSVPVAGRKHIVPWARYGMVVTDNEELAWTAADAGRLGVLASLRAAGFGEAALAEPVPRWVILRKLGRDAARMVLGAWPDLAPWRERPSYLAVACRATRTPKGENGDCDDDG